MQFEYFNARLLQNTALKIKQTVGAVTPPDGYAFGVLSALTNLEITNSDLVENVNSVYVNTLDIKIPTEETMVEYIEYVLELKRDSVIIKSNTMPEAISVPTGSVYMYMGETNTEFVHGYIYQNVKQDNLVVWERMDVQPAAKWGNIIGKISDQADLKLELDTLSDRIDNVEARGRFLALWNATTGLPETNPGESPYEYRAGDYYIVGIVGEENYKPTGTQFVIGQASTVIETEELATDDVYYYDGTTWKLQVNHGKTVSFANLVGQPDDNIALKNALDGKQNELIPGEGIKIENDVISATAATDATTVIIRSW